MSRASVTLCMFHFIGIKIYYYYCFNYYLFMYFFYLNVWLYNMWHSYFLFTSCAVCIENDNKTLVIKKK